jgi:copper homeostasis protein CutC/isopentenyldiphosphate isomerase
MPDEIVCLVDERNNVVGHAPRRMMRELRLIHRATYILVFNSRGELCVQQRTLTKDVYPGYLDPATGGVVLTGESYEESAGRELGEELGIGNTPLAHHFDFFFEDARSRVWGRVFSCLYDGPLRLQPEEVAAVSWMTIPEILKEPRCTPDGVEALRRYFTAPPASRRLVEVIACSLHDALAAHAGGAHRLELCTHLELGGLTPPLEMVAAVTRAVPLPVRVMIRTNDGFGATEQEMEIMEGQVAALVPFPIQGLVCGFVDTAGNLDFAAMDRVLRAAPPGWGFTLHHAFDAAAGRPEEKLAAVRSHGRCDRILTRAPGAIQGDDRLRIIAGGGLTAASRGQGEFHFGRAARRPHANDAPVHPEEVRQLQ